MTQMPGALGRAERLLEQTGTRLYFLGSRISVGLGLPVIAAVGTIGKIGAAFDKAMTESLAIMEDISPKIRAEMEDVAAQVAKSTKFSATQAAEGYFNLASAGLDAQQTMKALPVVARFAQAGVMDLAKSAEYLTDAQNALGLRTEDAGANTMEMARIADVLTEANNRAQGTVEQFAQALTNKAAASMRMHNMSLEEGVSVLTAYASVGKKGREAGTLMWMAMRDLERAAWKKRDAWKALNIQVFDANQKMRPMADILDDMARAFTGLTDVQKRAAIQQLGMNERSFHSISLIMHLGDSIRQMTGHLLKAGGATEEVANKQMLAFSNQLLQLKNRFELAAIVIFKEFVPVLTSYLLPMLEKGISMTVGLAHAFAALPDPMKAFVLASAAGIVVLGPMISLLGSMMLAARGVLLPINALSQAWLTWRAGGAAFEMFANSAFRAGKQGRATIEIIDAGGNVIRTFDRQAASAAASTGLMARSFAFLAHPATLITLGVAAAGLAIYAFTNRQSAAAKEIQKTGRAFHDKTEAMQALVSEYDKLTTKTGLTTAETTRLGEVIDGMAAILGVDRSAMLQNIETTDELTNAIRRQIMARREALEMAAAGIRMEAAAAAVEVGQAKDRLKNFYTNSAARRSAVSSGTGGAPGFAPMNALEQARRQTELERELAEKEQNLNTLQEQLRVLMGYTNKSLPMPVGGTRDPRIPVPSSKTDAPGGGGVGLGDGMTDAERERLANMVKELRGDEGIKQLAELRKAWDALNPAEQKNLEIVGRLWEKYEGLREKFNAIDPVLERATAQNVEFWNLMEEKARHDYKWDEMMPSVQDADVQKAVRFKDVWKEVFNAQSFKGSAGLTAFFQQHEGTLEKMQDQYAKLPPEIQRIVRSYMHWKTELSELSPEHTKAMAEATTSLRSHYDTVAALAKDKETERLLFSKSYSDKELVGLKTGLNARELELDKHYAEAYKALTMFADKNHKTEFMAGLQRINEMKANGAKILTTEQRLGLLRIAQSVGVTKSILRNEAKLSDDQLVEIIKRFEKYQELFTKFEGAVASLNASSGLAEELGLGDVADAFGKAAAAADTFFGGIKSVLVGEGFSQKMAGAIQAITGVIKAFKSVQDVGDQQDRVLTGAAAGAQMGSAFGGWGALIGAAAGALVGAFSDDPAWKKAQDKIRYMFNAKISKELAQAIADDAKQNFGNNLRAAGLANLMDVIAEAGGMDRSNVGSWAVRAREIFTEFERGSMKAGQAAQALDSVFPDLLKNGMKFNGMLTEQVRLLVIAERKFQTGSVAVREFVDAQMTNVAGGFNAVVAGLAGPMLRNLEKMKADLDRMKGDDALDFSDAMADKSMREYLKSERADNQEHFSRLGRIAVGAFGAAIASGKSFLQVLKDMGPGLSHLAELQRTFGFETEGAFRDLIRIADFARENEELVASIDGLNQMMLGLHNTGLLSQGLFADLSAEASQLFADLLSGGLTGDQAMAMMQPTLQTLWELMEDFGYETDAATAELIAQAEAAGMVGDKFRDPMDRIATAVEGLVDIFRQVFGIDVPDAAQAGVDGINNAFKNGLIRDWMVDVEVVPGKPGGVPGGPGNPGGGSEDAPTLPAYGKGGYVDGAHVAIVGDRPEWIIPDADLQHLPVNGGRPRTVDGPSSGSNMTIIVEANGEVLAEKTVPYIPGALERLGLN